MEEIALTTRGWAAYWAQQDDPQWYSQDHYPILAGELRTLLGDRTIKSVLEIGCGNGAIYPYLGFDDVAYRGVDYSAKMIEAFRRRYPSLDLHVAPGESYCDPDRKFDLIFSIGVVQYFTPAMLATHLSNARRMMHARSTLIMAQIPWRPLRWRTTIGWALGQLRLGRWKNALLSPFNGAGCGRWYSRRAIEKLGRQAGFDAAFFGSLVDPCRMTAVLTPANGRAAE
jgi:cyclopropane fatty-acyl-phospholipid synthase-like methyltransferase